MVPGKLYGIGVGTGDPELLTLKAKRILEELDCLIIPKSKEEKRSLAYSIVSQVVNKQWEIIDLILPMTNDKDRLNYCWSQAASEILGILETGKDAGFTTLGDPSIFSTFGYILEQVKKLNPETQVEVIPGISAINSIAARIGQPLVQGEENLVIIPALKDIHLEELNGIFDNLVLVKAGGQVERIIEWVDSQTKPLNTFLVSRCGFEDEVCTDNLKSIASRDLDYLSTVIIKSKKEGSD
ncbi:MAG: precorrin-2 C(20)-methyltransferase [Syntrophomonadaceae bacterium]|nr:precorrin-2 C(20)-methyltransferase [Syntrophomonadaceae bacterium]